VPELRLFTDRPHERFVDFASSRFVVARASGLLTSAGKLEMGDEIPQGTLSPQALRQEYQTPLARIDLLEHALKQPALRQACIERGTYSDFDQKAHAALADYAFGQAEAVPPPTSRARKTKGFSSVQDLEILTRHELADLCTRNRVDPNGNKQVLRERLASLLG
jgi:hypothetical protein